MTGGKGWMDVCMYGCMYVWLYVCMYVWLYVWLYVCMYVCVCVCWKLFRFPPSPRLLKTFLTFPSINTSFANCSCTTQGGSKQNRERCPRHRCDKSGCGKQSTADRSSGLEMKFSQERERNEKEGEEDREEEKERERDHIVLSTSGELQQPLWNGVLQGLCGADPRTHHHVSCWGMRPQCRPMLLCF